MARYMYACSITNNANGRDNGLSNITMDDVFMPRDDPVDTSDEEMDEFDRELEKVLLHGQSAREPTQGCCEDESEGSNS